jgi:hypothetical protein
LNAAASAKNGILISACSSIYLFTLLVADIVLLLQPVKLIFKVNSEVVNAGY